MGLLRRLSMFTFKIFEIPEGKSERTLDLSPGDLELGEEVSLKSGTIQINFDHSLHFILVNLSFDVKVELICDRSLDPFDFTVNQDFEILFKAEDIEESADENGAVRKIDLAHKQIDIEQDVLDTILVNLPAKKLHPRFLDEHGNPLEFETEKFGEPDEDEQGA